MPGFEIFGDEERAEVADVLETGVLFRYGFDDVRGGHWKTRTFEAELCRALGAEHCHVCSSGTAALDIAMAACGIGAGDEVIVPAFTFIATIEGVLQAGAVPVFADIDETLCLDPASVKDRITDRTRAVVPVHMCGSMARIDEISAVCAASDVVLIEDTAQALGATFRGQALGTFGAMGCYSFDPVKTITCGEGGAVVTDDEALYHRAEQYADHGHDHVGHDRGAEGHPILGTNHRISELGAAVGLAQLRKLDWIIQTQRRNKARLREAFATCSEVTFRTIPDPAGDSATFLSVLAPDEETARRWTSVLAGAGVPGCFYWYDNNWHYPRKWDHLREMRTPGKSPLTLLDPPPDLSEMDIERSDQVMSRTISMLVKLSWTDGELDDIQERIRTALEG
ncbi:MAG: DegT/DnrJ/EryC1/StrS family aminotransferase [Gemmatimonadetes bacterium]|nr:DegT/DnrJ/EryC1/StrS family aminotransferase [Gemmatimonadota bacterium]NNK49937.1 DegT/DnrJ/EryC1/StrS family aminotransferase [Gemmatimonadota bacterium]